VNLGFADQATVTTVKTGPALRVDLRRGNPTIDRSAAAEPGRQLSRAIP